MFGWPWSCWSSRPIHFCNLSSYWYHPNRFFFQQWNLSTIFQLWLLSCMSILTRFLKLNYHHYLLLNHLDFFNRYFIIASYLILIWLLLPLSIMIFPNLLIFTTIIHNRTVLITPPRMILIKQQQIISHLALAYINFFSTLKLSLKIHTLSLIFSFYCFVMTMMDSWSLRISSFSEAPNLIHIHTFYGRAIWLGNEISLADLTNGTLAVLHESWTFHCSSS